MEIKTKANLLTSIVLILACLRYFIIGGTYWGISFIYIGMGKLFENSSLYFFILGGTSIIFVLWVVGVSMVAYNKTLTLLTSVGCMFTSIFMLAGISNIFANVPTIFPILLACGSLIGMCEFGILNVELGRLREEVD